MPSPHRPLDIFPITTRTLQVLRVADVTPGMRRVTLGGHQLAAHVADNGYPVAAFRSDGFDDEFKLVLRHPDAERVVGPTQNDGVLDWPRDDQLLLFRTYTVRRWDEAAGEIDVDLVLHDTGAASGWARCVRPGEDVQIAGPKMSAPHPRGVDWVLVGGDETALPAIGRMLEEWPAGARGQVFIEVESDAHRQDLPIPTGVDLTWLTRGGAPAGTTTHLFDALQAAPWWDGDCFAWVAGEAGTLVAIRRWLRRDRGLDASRVQVAGYWRRRQVDPDTAVRTGSAPHRVAELVAVVAPFSLRVAATLGVGQALASGPLTAAQVADRTGGDPVGITKLLRHLAVLDLVEQVDGRWSLTASGADLADDDQTPYLDLDGVHARREIGAALSLLEAIRGGTPAAWFESSWEAQVAEKPAWVRDLARAQDEDAAFIASGLAASAPLSGLSRVAVAGSGAAVVAQALVARHPALLVDLVGTPSTLTAVADLHAPHPRIRPQVGSLLEARPEPVDAVLLLDSMTTLADVDAIHVLRRAADSLTPRGSVLVFGEVLGDHPDAHDCEDDLMAFALTGGGMRTDDEIRGLFRAAGLGEPRRTTVGWGYGLYAGVSGPGSAR